MSSLSPPRILIGQIEGASGSEVQVGPLGRFVEVTLHSVEAVLAFLVKHTQVLTITGDVPEEFTEDESSPYDYVQ